MEKKGCRAESRRRKKTKDRGSPRANLGNAKARRQNASTKKPHKHTTKTPMATKDALKCTYNARHRENAK